VVVDLEEEEGIGGNVREDGEFIIDTNNKRNE